MIGRRRSPPCGCISRRHRYSRPGLPLRPGGQAQGRVAMALLAHTPPGLRHDSERLAYAREILRGEAAALELVAQRLGASFLQAVELFSRCAGRVALTGTGKSADVGQKIAGTLNSTGTRAY